MDNSVLFGGIGLLCICYYCMMSCVIGIYYALYGRFPSPGTNNTNNNNNKPKVPPKTPPGTGTGAPPMAAPGAGASSITPESGEVFKDNSCCVIGAYQQSDGTIIGMGRDGTGMYTRTKLTDPWISISGTVFQGWSVKSIAELNGDLKGHYIGVGTDNICYVTNKANLSAAGWVKLTLANTTSITITGDGTWIGVHTDGGLHVQNKASKDWEMQGGIPGGMLSIVKMQDGTFVGVGKDNKLYTARTISVGSTWTKVDDRGSVTSIFLLNDGRLAGIGGNKIYIRPKLTDDWLGPV